MARKHVKISSRMLFTWFMLGGLILLFAPQNWTNKFQFVFTRLFGWPLSISRAVSLSVRARQMSGDVVSRGEYDRLQNHLANVMEELSQERRKVEALSGLHSRPALEGAKFVLADIITNSVGGLNKTFIINRGQSDGLAKDQLVLGDNSIIGTISEVSSRTAEVRLITDSASNMAVNIGELNVNRVMEGDGRDSAKVRMLSIKHQVKAGDNVYACKKAGFLDTPFIVGEVAQCKRDDENPSLWDITVRPACNIDGLNGVVVLIMNPQN
jgi:rod shape-determining protein MreC